MTEEHTKTLGFREGVVTIIIPKTIRTCCYPIIQEWVKLVLEELEKRSQNENFKQ